MAIDTSGNVKLDGSTDPKTINVNGKEVTLTPDGDKLKIECNGKTVNVYANDAGYVSVDEKGNVKTGKVETGGNGNGGNKMKDNSPKKGGGTDKKPPGGKGKSSTAKSKVSVAKVINGFGARIGAQVGGINFTEIHGDVSGDYLDLRYVSIENTSLMFMSNNNKEEPLDPDLTILQIIPQ